MVLDFNNIIKNQAHVSKSFIDTSVIIRGDLNFIDTLEIQGFVIGDIYSDFKSISFLNIGRNSQINGNITSTNIFIFGKVIGNVHAQHVEIEENAVILGDIYYDSIEIHSGAKITGSMSLNNQLSKIAFNSSRGLIAESLSKKGISTHLNSKSSPTVEQSKHFEFQV